MTEIENLNCALSTGDQQAIQIALSNIILKKGVAFVAKESGLSRENLYKAIKPDANPRFDTVVRALRACGVTLSV